MLTLLKWFFERVNFVGLAEAQRGRNNRMTAARLLNAMVVAYEIVELFEALLEQLKGLLESQQRGPKSAQFSVNYHRLDALLEQQATNLDKLDHLFRDIYAEVRLMDAKFERTYSEMFPGKWGILMDARLLLSEARLPTHEDHPLPLSDGSNIAPYRPGLTYRTLWLSPNRPDCDRERDRRLLHGDDGTEKEIIDVHPTDRAPFFAELERYLREEKPFDQVAQLRAAADQYRDALERNLTISEVLAEFGKVRRQW